MHDMYINTNELPHADIFDSCSLWWCVDFVS